MNDMSITTAGSAPRATHERADRNEIELRIGGMHCPHCPASIEEALRHLDGVSVAHVNFANPSRFSRYSMYSRCATHAPIRPPTLTICCARSRRCSDGARSAVGAPAILACASQNSRSAKAGRPGRGMPFSIFASARRLISGKQPPSELDSYPVVKLFNAYGPGTWLVTEIDPDNHDVAWALAGLDMGCAEFSTTSLSELSSLRHPFGFPIIERARHWTASSPISAYIRASCAAGRIVEPAENAQLIREGQHQ